jgi:hypothetical protein
MPALLSTGGGVPGRIAWGKAFGPLTSGDGEGAQASVFRLRKGDFAAGDFAAGDFAARDFRDKRGGGGL